MALFDCTKIVLKRYSSGQNVKTLQTALKQLGYYTRQVDGDFGYYTQQAVKKFQSSYKLTSDGIFGPETCKKLSSVMDSKNSTITTSVEQFDCSKTNLRSGDTGDSVRKLQNMLSILGYYTGKIDGIFGTYTTSAVKKFQKDTKHSQDGVFGPKTCKSLNEAYASKQKSTTTTTNTATPSVSNSIPDYMKQEHCKLVVFPELVVLPESQTGEESNTKTTTGGSINTDTNFDCSKIDLKKGSKGDEVSKLQTILKARGYYTRQVDGDYGKYTALAVKKLQKAQGNSQDGQFGPKTCNSLQKISTTSNIATGTQESKQTNYIINDIIPTPNFSSDVEGLSYEVTLTTPFSIEKMSHIRKLQKTECTLYLENDEIIKHTGYINEIKISNTDDSDFIELQLVGYTVFLEQTIEIPEDVTAKKSELLKKFIEEGGLKLNLDLTGLVDSEYTIHAQKSDNTTISSGNGTKTVSECFDMAKPFVHPYHSKKYERGSSTHDPDEAWAAYQAGTRNFDCFGTSAFLFYTIKNFAKAPVRVIHRRSRAAKSGTHYTVQLKENGSWIDPKSEYSKLDSYLRCGSGAIAQIHQVYEGG